MAKAPKDGGRLHNPKPELDAPADTRSTKKLRGYCKGYLRATLGTLKDLLSETEEGVRIHKADAWQIKLLILEFETEMFALFKGMRVQQDGVRDTIDAPTRTDTSNVVSFMIRRGATQG
jgi:hypothetical protein